MLGAADACHKAKLYRSPLSGTLRPLISLTRTITSISTSILAPRHLVHSLLQASSRDCSPIVATMEIEVANIARDATVWDVRRKIGSILHSDYFYNATDPKDRPAYASPGHRCTAGRN